MKFTDAQFDQVILDIPKEEKHPHLLGETIFREQSKNLVKEHLSARSLLKGAA